MRKFCWKLLVLLAFSVYAEDEKVVVVGSAKELKGIAAKKVIWKTDEAEMVLIPYKVVIPEKTEPAVYDEFGDLVSAEIVVPEQINSLRIPFQGLVKGCKLLHLLRSARWNQRTGPKDSNLGTELGQYATRGTSHSRMQDVSND